MSSKRVSSQVNKVVQLILKEHWEVEVAIEAVFASVADEIDITTFTNLVVDELEKE